MSRVTVAVDRIVVGVLALALVAAGVVAVAWHLGLPPAPDGVLSLPGVRAATGQPWWPWAVAGTGLLLVTAGLRWLTAHLPRRPGRTRLPGSEPAGRLTVDLQQLASAAAAELAARPGIRSARGRTVEDRGRVVVRVVATVARDADLPLATGAAEDVRRHLEEAIGPELPIRVELRAANRREDRSVR